MKGETNKKRSRTPEEIRELYDDMHLGKVLLFLRLRGVKLHDRTGLIAVLEFAWLLPTFIFFILASALCEIASNVIPVLTKLSLRMSYLRPVRGSITNKRPGTSLLRIAQCLYSPDIIEKTFEPLIADWRMEYFEALGQGHNLKARCLSARYTYSFVVAIVVSKAYSILKSLRPAEK